MFDVEFDTFLCGYCFLGLVMKNPSVLTENSLEFSVWFSKISCIHAFNKSGRRLEFFIYDVIRGKTSAAIFEV